MDNPAHAIPASAKLQQAVLIAYFSSARTLFQRYQGVCPEREAIVAAHPYGGTIKTDIRPKEEFRRFRQRGG